MNQQPSPSPRNSEDSATIAGAILSLLAALWMLFGLSWMSGMQWGHMREGGMMDRMHPWLWHDSAMHSFVAPMGWPWPGIVAGIAVLVCSILLFVRPSRKGVWAGIIIAGSVLVAMTSMGGFFPGILGAVGGLVALLGGPSREQAPRERSELDREGHSEPSGR